MKKVIVLMLAVITLLCSAVPALAAESSYEIVVDGNATRAVAVMQDGTLMLPMKAVSKALGYKISYKATEKTYHLKNGNRACDITMGSSIYAAYSLNSLGMTAPTDLGSEPMLISGTIYVPAELYRVLLGNTDKAVKIDGGCVYINSKAGKKKPDNNPSEKYTITVNGRRQKAEGQMIDGTVMVPLKHVAKELGYKVSYSSRNKSYHLENKENACDVEFGSSIYTVYSTRAIGTTSPEDLGSEPVIVNRIIYVPVELFKVLLGNYDQAVVISGSKIAIQRVGIGSANPNA